MKTFLFALLAIPFLSTATTIQKWDMAGNSIPVLHNQDPRVPINLIIGNKSTGLVAIADLRGELELGSLCYNHGEERGLRAVGPFEINGKYVKFSGGCIGKDGIMTPETKLGKDYLNNLVWSGTPIKIDIGDGVVLNFPASDISDLKKKIKTFNDAM